MRVVLLFVILLLSECCVVAQELSFDAKFESYFDNREYSCSDDMARRSGTDFAVRFTPEISLAFGGGNSLSIGVEAVRPMGCDCGSLFDGVSAIAYYAFDSSEWSVSVGVFSRGRIALDGYSTAFFSEDYLLDDDLVEGFACRYMVDKSYVELVCDWEGEVSTSCREKFRLLSSARRYWSEVYLGYNLSMTHFAGADSAIFDNVVDSFLINTSVGVRFGVGDVDLDANVSYLQSLQRDRSFCRDWLSPSMFGVALSCSFDYLSIDERFYVGDDLMPLYDGHLLDEGVYMEYGEQLYTGDPFFRAYGGFYNRAALRYERRFCDGKIGLRAEFITHINGDGVATEQLLDLSVNLGVKIREVRLKK